MSLVEFLPLLWIAGVVGGIGQAIAGRSLGGCLVSVPVGLIGALVGGVLARALGLSELLVVNIGGHSYPVVWSILGAVALVSLLTPRRRVLG